MMADVKFHLKDAASVEKTTIFMIYRGTRPLTKWSTGEKVLPANWNKEKCRVRRVKGINYRLVNDKLDRISRDVNALVLKMDMEGGVVTPKKIKDYLNEKYKNAHPGEVFIEPNRSKDLISYMVYHKENMRGQNKPIWKSYDSTVKILRSYFRVYGYHSYEDIDFDFYSNFTSYLYGKRYTTNYIGRNVKNLKTVMGYAYDDKLHRNDIFRSKRFKVLSEPVYNVFLNEDELEKIHKTDLSFNKMYEKTKDLFLIGCFVGSRFSNWINMGDALIKDGMIVYESVKHRERIEFPLHWIVLDIIKKYEGGFPKPITNQVFNRVVKEVCKEAGINEDVLIVKTIGGKRTTVKKPKYKLITSHTARRSLATNLYLNNVRTKVAMYATGHAKVDQYLAYVKTSIQEELEDLKNNPFFKKK